MSRLCSQPNRFVLSHTRRIDNTIIEDTEVDKNNNTARRRYIVRCPGRGLLKALYISLPGRSSHSDNMLTYVEIIQPRCNCYANIILKYLLLSFTARNYFTLLSEQCNLTVCIYIISNLCIYIMLKYSSQTA